MNPLRVVLAFAGRIDRTTFAIGLVAVVAVFSIAIQASLAALPWLAEALAPRGINAGFALNVIWSVLGVLLVWSVIALGAKRLRDGGRSPWWGVAAVVPLATLAVLNDAIFLASRTFTLPGPVQTAVLVVAGTIGLCVLWECIAGVSNE